MQRSLAAFLVGLLTVSCAPTPSSTPAPPTPSAPATPSASAAALTITASGEACGPWWMGCSLYLAIEEPGWDVVPGWAPRAEDTQIDVALAAGSDGPMSVRGVAAQGRAWINPGNYRVVVLNNSMSDTETQRTRDAEITCSLDTSIPWGSRAVTLAVVFADARCAITMTSTGAPPS